MGRSQGQTASGCVATHWIDHQAGVGIASHLGTEGWPDYAFAFHDSDEIGPRMVARVAKHTGLRPEDL